MEKIWLDSYPPGVPAEIDPDAYRSVPEVFEQSAARFAERPAFSNFGVTLTYRQLERHVHALAAYLQVELGLERGDRVAIMMPNLLQNPVAIFAILRAGLTVVNTNPLYTPRELEHQLKDSGARAIIVVENFASTLEAVLERTQVEHVILTRMGDLLGVKGHVVNLVVKHVKKLVPAYRLPSAVPFKAALARGAALEPRPLACTPEDLAFLQYTGGTTGVAKGAMLTHRNVVANLEQASAWLAPSTRAGEELVITALPLYHIFSLTANCLTFMKIGGHNHLITNPRDMPGFVRELRAVPFTAITGVNTLFNGLLHTPGFADVDFSHLHLAIGGGMAVQRAVAEEWKRVTGVALIEAYGLTETSPAVTINPLDLSAFNASIGLPVPSTEVSLRDDEGTEVAPGQAGELCVRGPQVMRGYWQRPQETAAVLDGAGWLRTGDIAEMDARGFLRIIDRKKDLILVSGFNVYPNEIEDVVAAHPGVLEVGAIGVPDARTGEAVKIVVVKKDPALDEQAIIAYCRERLTGYKVPHHVEFRDELPKSNVGKILRRELRGPAAT